MTREAFDRKASDWDAYTQTPAGQLREELNYRYLQPHLPSPPAVILDAGCGTGNLGIRLASQGYTVHLLDFSSKMLAIAQQRAQAVGVESRIQVHVQDILAATLPNRYDAVICHTLLEYTPDVEGAVRKLAGLLVAGGLFSLVFVNRYADVLKLALNKRDFASARVALDSYASPADLFGVPRQTFDSDTLRTILDAVGVTVQAEYGVRVFADYVDDWQASAERFAEMLDLEIAVAARDPFMHIGRYGQFIGKRSPLHVEP